MGRLYFKPHDGVTFDGLRGPNSSNICTHYGQLEGCNHGVGWDSFLCVWILTNLEYALFHILLVSNLVYFSFFFKLISFPSITKLNLKSVVLTSETRVPGHNYKAHIHG